MSVPYFSTPTGLEVAKQFVLVDGVGSKLLLRPTSTLVALRLVNYGLGFENNLMFMWVNVHWFAINYKQIGQIHDLYDIVI